MIRFESHPECSDFGLVCTIVLTQSVLSISGLRRMNSKKAQTDIELRVIDAEEGEVARV